MENKFHGKVIAIGERKTGTSKNGPYALDNFVVEEMNEQYPKRISLKVISNETSHRWKNMGIKLGEELTAYFDIDAHPYNDKWYNDITCYKVERGTSVLAPSDNEPVKTIVQQLSENKAVEALKQAGFDEVASKNVQQSELPF